jgi:hypothetical protein
VLLEVTFGAFFAARDLGRGEVKATFTDNSTYCRKGYYVGVFLEVMMDNSPTSS